MIFGNLLKALCRCLLVIFGNGYLAKLVQRGVAYLVTLLTAFKALIKKRFCRFYIVIFDLLSAACVKLLGRKRTYKLFLL